MHTTLEHALSRVSQVPLASLPTPFERITRAEQILNYSDIYIKRDDLTGLGPGGNKLRSLEFLLGDALDQGTDVILVATIKSVYIDRSRLRPPRAPLHSDPQRCRTGAQRGKHSSQSPARRRITLSRRGLFSGTCRSCKHSRSEAF